VEGKKPEFREIAEVEYTLKVGDEIGNCEIVATGRRATHPILTRVREMGHPALILFSSGSTGKSKAAVHDFLHSIFPHCAPAPELRFTDNGVQRIAIPDGVLPLRDFGFVFEIKYSHCPEAWWQTEKLYKPLLEKWFCRPFSSIEICRHYDPAVPFPSPVTLIGDLEEWCAEPRTEFGVFEWRK
jgi:hypothetical protein